MSHISVTVGFGPFPPVLHFIVAPLHCEIALNISMNGTGWIRWPILDEVNSKPFRSTEPNHCCDGHTEMFSMFCREGSRDKCTKKVHRVIKFYLISWIGEADKKRVCLDQERTRTLSAMPSGC
jgi:hypothetical protein